MGNVDINLRLRPLRFAFLVRPDDAKQTAEIFRVNTCLWGGKFNPIVPCFKRLPAWWGRKDYRFENAKQVINGYFDFFEPDFLVEAEKGLADGYGFDPGRVIGLNDILAHDEEKAAHKYGLSVHGLYAELYKKEFQFQRRHTCNILHVMAKEKAFENFVACNFGAFPDQKALNYFENNYKYIFNPKVIELDAVTLLKLYQCGYSSSSSSSSALEIGHKKIKVNYNGRYHPILFVMDAYESRDLIDFWNLRAVCADVVAIPIQWIEELSSFCKKFIIDKHRIHPIPMFSRSMVKKDIEEIHEKYLCVNKEAANYYQTYPTMWDRTTDELGSFMRPTLESAHSRLDITVNDNKRAIHFDLLSPGFAEDYSSRVRWANVVRLREWGQENQIATVFPRDYGPSFSELSFFEKTPFPTREGLVIFIENNNVSKYWELVDGATAVKTWLANNKIETVLSESGKATQQIIQTLGGLQGVRSLARKRTIELLNEMARSVSRSKHFEEFHGKLSEAADKSLWKNENFETLVKHGAVELDLQLKCSNCSNHSWYSFKRLDDVLICERCLKRFNFPITTPKDPNHCRWAYRVVGPFALTRYAGGGYAAALAIHFFTDITRGIAGFEAGITWSPGQELTLANGKPLEVDFILWNQRRRPGIDCPTQVVFGESKSFGNAERAFEQKDVDRMALLAKSFPGSILVFATMREAKDFSKEEIRRIKKLTEWGREYDKEHERSRAPVIILTGTELFAGRDRQWCRYRCLDLDTAWKEKSGRHAELIKDNRPSLGQNPLEMLADLTQQLYLGMPSYEDWFENKFQEKLERRKKTSQSAHRNARYYKLVA